MKKNGCLTWIIGFVIVALLLFLYSFVWIPAMGFIIYYIIKKDFSGKRRRNFIISIGVFITSILVFFWMGNSSPSLTGLNADWGKNSFDISDTVNVNISPTPADAKIETLSLSDNSVAELNYSDGKALVSFKNTGTATLTFVANDSITSNATVITVTFKIAEEAERKENEEKKRKEHEEQKLIEEEKAQREAEKKAAQEASTQAEAQAQQAALEAQTNQTSNDPVVYITNTGGKYHRAGCRFLKHSQIEKHLSEVQGAYGPCGVCNPPQ